MKPAPTIRSPFLAPVLVAGACLGAPQQAPPPTAPHDFRTELRGQAVRVRHGDVEGLVLARYGAGAIEFFWVRDFSAWMPDPSLSPVGTRVSTQEEPAGFWPTDVCGFGTDRVCVAGNTPAGARIDLWTLDTRAELAEPRRDASGRMRYPATRIPVLSKVVLVDARQDLGRVRCMFRDHGAPDVLFVQFDAQRDLRALDTRTGEWTTAVTVAQEPLLNATLEDRWSDHHGLGYLYAFATPDDRLLLLFDSDLDGALDLADTRRLEGSEWSFGPVDFSDPAGYVEYF